MGDPLEAVELAGKVSHREVVGVGPGVAVLGEEGHVCKAVRLLWGIVEHGGRRDGQRGLEASRIDAEVELAVTRVVELGQVEGVGEDFEAEVVRSEHVEYVLLNRGGNHAVILYLSEKANSYATALI